MSLIMSSDSQEKKAGPQAGADTVNTSSEKGKTILIILLIIILIPVILYSAFLLLFCANTYTKIEECGNFTVASGYFSGYHKLLGQNHAAIVAYTFDDSDSGKEIVIPDTFDKVKIRELGGFCGRGSPMPFHISYGDNTVYDTLKKESREQYGSSYSDLEDGRLHYDEIIYNDVTLYLGKNIKSIYTFSSVTMFAHKDGRTIAFCPRYYVICSEKNKKFYSENGVLYHRDGTVFDQFIYVRQSLPQP